ncbi:MAG: helix-turn-helix domain-containing protein [Chitinophagales bacterium]|nr:helix-turn-helix domain-containing protein [Chitinophagaceae bacterium]MCB9065705.1 helix-turn-helix domain-containing protein [Chitinophagales bacterium]
MHAKLHHSVCVFNITDDMSTVFSAGEYRHDLLSILMLQDADNTVIVGNSEIHIKGDALCFLTHNQPLVTAEDLRGECTVIQFNADVFCIQKHDAEVGCNGILFNNLYEPPILAVDRDQLNSFMDIAQRMVVEVEQRNTCCVDMLESYLKQFLISAVRIKKAEQGALKEAQYVEHDKMQQLRQLMDKHYKEQRKLSFYADKLCLSESAIHKLTHKHWGKSFIAILSEKLIMDAKSLLFLTNDTVKEICYDLGFNDPAYFTRFFKKHSGTTPESYRQTIRNSTTTV